MGILFEMDCKTAEICQKCFVASEFLGWLGVYWLTGTTKQGSVRVFWEKHKQMSCLLAVEACLKLQRFILFVTTAEMDEENPKYCLVMPQANSLCNTYRVCCKPRTVVNMPQGSDRRRKRVCGAHPGDAEFLSQKCCFIWAKKFFNL